MPAAAVLVRGQVITVAATRVAMNDVPVTSEDAASTDITGTPTLEVPEQRGPQSTTADSGEAASAAVSAGAAPSLWRNRSFNLLWGSQFLSGLGANMSALAFPLLVLAVTGSAVNAGVVGTVEGLVRLVLTAPAGVLADRVDRKRAMLACDAIRLAAYVLLAILIAAGWAYLWVIVLVAIIDSAGSSVFNTAEMAALRTVVGVEQVPYAHARNEARHQAAALVGPPIGGVLFGLARALPFVADAISYALSFIGISLIRTRLQEERTEPSGSAAADMREGLTFSWRSPVIRAALILAPPLNFAINGLIFAGILILRGDGLAPGLIGLFETIIAVGGLLGAIAAGPMQKLFSMRALILGITWLAAAMLAADALLTGSLALAVPIAIVILLSPATNAALFGYIAAITPDRLQGRVMAVLFAVALSLASLAPLAAGAFYDTFGARATVWWFAGFTALSAIAATASGVIRGMSGKPGEEAAAAAAS